MLNLLYSDFTDLQELRARESRTALLNGAVGYLKYGKEKDIFEKALCKKQFCSGLQETDMITLKAQVCVIVIVFSYH